MKSSEELNAHRVPNTDAEGRPFSHEVVEAVWQKARTMGIYETLRVDAWGWTIVHQDFGNLRSRYGWEIDHIIPVALGGTDDISNLQPLQWENNRRKDEIQGIAEPVHAVKAHATKAHPVSPSSPGQGQGSGHAPKKKHA